MLTPWKRASSTELVLTSSLLIFIDLFKPQETPSRLSNLVKFKLLVQGRSGIELAMLQIPQVAHGSMSLLHSLPKVRVAEPGLKVVCFEAESHGAQAGCGLWS